jgi:hypothetical protein
MLLQNSKIISLQIHVFLFKTLDVHITLVKERNISLNTVTCNLRNYFIHAYLFVVFSFLGVGGGGLSLGKCYTIKSKLYIRLRLTFHNADMVTE